MSEPELLELVRQYEMASLGSSVAAGATIATTLYPSNAPLTTLELDRYNALNGFLARPFGNEIENRSQIVMPVLRDTVAWMMPQLMRMFVGSKTICRFDAENPQDEQQAETETMVVNHVFMRDNDGFTILHDFFWDALLMRNGYVEVYTEEKKEVKEETYSGMSEIELTELLQDKDDEKIEVIEQKEYTQDVLLPLPQMGMQGSQASQGPSQFVMKVPCWDLKIRRTGQVKRTKVCCLPPEEMRVTPRARAGMEDIGFSMHITNKTRSDLITEGFKKSVVNGLAAGRPNWLEIDALARNVTVDQLSIENPSDYAMQEIEVRKVVIKVDFDGDGVAELRRLLIAGDKILENELIEETPFVSGEPMRMPHRHTGISLYDLVMDLQILSTDLWRQGIDNLRNANNTRVAVDWRNCNFDDLLTSRPGSPIRGNGPPGQWILPIQTPSNLVEQVIPALQYVDQLRSNRTGIGKGTMGLDPDELQNVTKGGQLAAMSAQTLILELIARMLAEGVKWMFLKIHAELMRHQDKPLDFEISGKWLTVDPSQWRRRTKITPNVGLGSGNREEMRTNVNLLAGAQTQLAQMGLVGPKQAYETFKMVCESIGISSPERFAMDPASPEYAQHMKQMAQSQPPNPQVQVAQIKAQSTQAQEQAETQRQVQKLQGQLIDSKMQLLHSAQAQQEQLGHAAVEGHNDRMVEMGSQHAQMLQAIMKALSPIIASQLKGAQEANAGDVLASDTTTADRSLE